MGNFIVLRSRNDLISFIDNTRNKFDCIEDWENFFGFKLKCDDVGNELETVSDYADRSSFIVEPNADEYPVVVYHTCTNERDRFGKLKIEIFDYISIYELSSKRV